MGTGDFTAGGTLLTVDYSYHIQSRRSTINTPTTHTGVPVSWSDKPLGSYLLLGCNYAHKKR